jgi:hypothetical protein
MKTEGDRVTRGGMLTERFDDAVAYALAAHDDQRRKGSSVPYAAHLLGVASTVLEAGGTESEAIAGLLHDVVEDQGGADRLADVLARFGPEIATVVHECSADDKTDDPGWRARKERYIAGLATCSDSALLVSLADKVYNARAILDDYRAIGPSVWSRFGADEPKDETILWYYRSLYTAYSARPEAPRRLLAELGRTIAQLELLTQRPPCPDCRAGDVAVIVWGLPTLDDFETAFDWGVELGGCIVPEVAPDFRCQVCGFAWATSERGRHA